MYGTVQLYGSACVVICCQYFLFMVTNAAARMIEILIYAIMVTVAESLLADFIIVNYLFIIIIRVLVLSVKKKQKHPVTMHHSC